MNQVSISILVVAACATTGGDSDGADDAFLTGGIAEGSPEARGVLRVANELTRAQLDTGVGLAANATAAIDKARRGSDGVANTADDRAFTTLAELDAVKYVGPAALNRLLAYARDHGYVADLTWPPNPWVVDSSCTPIAFAQLVAKFGPGDTTAMLGHAMVRGRTRDACNAVTGCPPWREPDRVWLEKFEYINGNPEISYIGVPDSLEITATVRGDQIVVGFAGNAIATPSARIAAAIVALPSGVLPDDDWGDQILGFVPADSVSPLVLTFPTRASHGSERAMWDQRVCADGRVQFVTEATTTNYQQLAIYGRLW